MTYYDRKAELRDEVKHKKAEMSGTVIAVYPDPDNSIKILVDVRGMDDKIYYGSPQENWEVVKIREELE